MSPAIRTTVFAIAIGLSLAACDGNDAAQSGTAVPPAGNATPNPGTAARDSTGSMSGMTGMNAATTSLADSMKAHFRGVNAMTAEQLKSALPAHRALIANTLSRLSTDMRQMNMPADQAWTALVDSIRQDLVHLPDLSGSELKLLMPRHDARVARLVAMHQTMMKKMGM